MEKNVLFVTERKWHEILDQAKNDKTIFIKIDKSYDTLQELKTYVENSGATNINHLGFIFSQSNKHIKLLNTLYLPYDDVETPEWIEFVDFLNFMKQQYNVKEYTIGSCKFSINAAQCITDLKNIHNIDLVTTDKRISGIDMGTVPMEEYIDKPEIYLQIGGYDKVYTYDNGNYILK